MLYIAIGILGATVMPHNLYLHSSIVQTRRYEETADGRREAVRFAFIDSTLALSFAFFINAAILIVAAATFHTSGHSEVAEIQDAYKLLTPLLGAGASASVRARAAGVRAELDAHRDAGRPDRDGGVPQHPPPAVAPAAHHPLIAIVPAVIVAIFYGESGTAKLLILSQVILSLQLSFAVFPLVMFTSDRAKMGRFANSPLGQSARVDDRHRDRGAQRLAAHPDVPRLVRHGLMYKRILVPLEHSAYDDAIVEHVRELALFCKASIVLIHVADGWAARNVKQLNLRESEEMRVDREYLEQRCASLEAAGIETDCLLAARRSVARDLGGRGARRMRPHRDVDARPSLHQGSRLRQRRERSAPHVPRSGAARARRTPRLRPAAGVQT